MAQNSNIEWTDDTVNLWWGCSKVHTGCKYCYAENLSDKRLGNNIWGEQKLRKLIKSAFKDLEKYQRKAAATGCKRKVFVGSMMDVFEEEKALENPTDKFLNTGDLRKELFERISNDKYENLIFLFLTKRPRNIWKMIPNDWSHGRHNVYFGTSISNQETVKYANMLTNSLKFQNLFLSIEPQVGEITEIDLSAIDWVIQGGESGHKKRKFELKWGYQMMDICKAFNVPFFFKQIDKKQEIPKDLLIREFPSEF